MKKVTNIKCLKGNKYEVLIDKEKHIFYADTLINNNLLAPRDITLDEFLKIKKDDLIIFGYEKAVSFILYKNRTEKEVINKLKTFSLSDDDINKVVLKLKEKGYLDEDKYIKSYINDKVKLTLNGPYKIKNELINKGVNENKIDLYLKEIDNSIWIIKINRITIKKIKTNKNLSRKMFIHKLDNYLFNEGFEKDMYNDIINNIKINDDDIYEKEYNKLLNKYKKEITLI